MNEPLVEEIGRLVADLPDGALRALQRALEAAGSDNAVLDAVPTEVYRERARALLRARDVAGARSEALALALAAARERETAARAQRVSVVWTGPETPAVPVRRTEQALVELIGAARNRLIVMSFAVYKIPGIAAAIVACAERGCDVAVIVESSSESGGKVTFEMAPQLGTKVAEQATIYTWPEKLRPDLGAGKRASLHAKCAVADGELLLVSSANLTEYALTTNMELGLLVEGGETPARVQAHLEALIAQGILQPIRPDAR